MTVIPDLRRFRYRLDRVARSPLATLRRRAFRVRRTVQKAGENLAATLRPIALDGRKPGQLTATMLTPAGIWLLLLAVALLLVLTQPVML
jgi:hypothetical protein